MGCSASTSTLNDSFNKSSNINDRGKEIKNKTEELLKAIEPAVKFQYHTTKKQVKLNIKYLPQKAGKTNYSREACLEMICNYFNNNTFTQDTIHELLDLEDLTKYQIGDTEETAGIFRIIRKIGLILPENEEMCQTYTNKEEYENNVNYLVSELDKGYPILIGMWGEGFIDLINHPEGGFTHYALLIGYDLYQKDFYLNDPYDEERNIINFDEFFNNYRQNSEGSLFQIKFVGF